MAITNISSPIHTFLSLRSNQSFYRLVAAEKLRLTEVGIEQELIDAVCRYLTVMSAISAGRIVLSSASITVPKLRIMYIMLNKQYTAFRTALYPAFSACR